MTPAFSDDWLTVHLGDCREVMAAMEPESVHCVVTSPPYWGLRDYGTEGQLGLEPTPEAYVESMVAVFREVRRVLRSDGTVWLNLGDSYTGGKTGRDDAARRNGHGSFADGEYRAGQDGMGGSGGRNRGVPAGMKPKDLVGIPWRVAFALQADGWYLRSDVIWAKPNPMPESVTDRPTKAHEYIFLLSKSPRYYFDHLAVREPSIGTSAHDLTGMGYTAPGQSPQGGNRRWPDIGPKHGTTDNHRSDYEPMVANAGRNIRSVWTIPTQPYPGAHFATFPQALVEPCIKAGSPKGGTVLDPFAGSGTTGLVAQRLSRRAVLIELNADYLSQVMDRNRDIPLGLGA